MKKNFLFNDLEEQKNDVKKLLEINRRIINLNGIIYKKICWNFLLMNYQIKIFSIVLCRKLILWFVFWMIIWNSVKLMFIKILSWNILNWWKFSIAIILILCKKFWIFFCENLRKYFFSRKMEFCMKILFFLYYVFN